MGAAPQVLELSRMWVGKRRVCLDGNVMPTVHYKYGNNLIPCEVLRKFDGSYQIRFKDPESDRTTTLWIHKDNLVFPQFSELVF